MSVSLNQLDVRKGPVAKSRNHQGVIKTTINGLTVGTVKGDLILKNGGKMDGRRLKVEGYKRASQDDRSFHTQASFLKVTPKVSLRIVETTGHTPKNTFKLHPATEQALKEKKPVNLDWSGKAATLKSTTSLAHTTL